MKELDATDQMFAEFGKKALHILASGDTSGLSESAGELEMEVAFIGAKFQRHDTVFVLSVDGPSPRIIECEVIETKLSYNDYRWYYLFEKTGRRVGNFHESMVFATAKECAEFYKDFCVKILRGERG